MSTQDPFGDAPEASDDIIDPAAGYKVPSEEDDPYRPIGQYITAEDGTQKPAPGCVNKLTTIGKLCAITGKTGPKGPMLLFQYVVTEGAFAGREFDLYVSFSPAARFKLVETYGAHGLPTEGPWPKPKALGTYVQILLQDEEYNGRYSAKIKSVKAHPKGVGFRGAAELS